MNRNKLEEEYQKLKTLEDTDDGIFDFKEMLLESDNEAILDFHLNILNNEDDEYLRTQFFSFFTERNDKNKVSEFLHNKYTADIKEASLLGNVIQLLGHLRSKYAKSVASQNIDSTDREIRYKSIIVLGWVGDEKDIMALNNRLLNDRDGEIRGYSATAMRQIWFNHPETKKEILQYLKQSITDETHEKALEGIILTAQDLLKKKLGLKESPYGDVSGDVFLAKAKTVDILNTI